MARTHTLALWLAILASGVTVLAPVWTGTYGFHILVWNWPEYVVAIGLWIILVAIAVNLDRSLGNPNA